MLIVTDDCVKWCYFCILMISEVSLCFNMAFAGASNSSRAV